MHKRVLVIDDEENILATIAGSLSDEGFIVETASSGARGVLAARSFRPDVVLLDVWMPGEDGLVILEKLKRSDPNLVVVIMSGHGSVETAVRAIKLGAFDFLEKPLHIDKLLLILEHALALQSLEEENRRLRAELTQGERLIGDSPAMTRLRQLIDLAAPSNGWVLIQGENGAGKELVARALHEGSPRSRGRFVAVNCAAIPEELIESELFGHERGSFTGAHERKIGKFELAHGGTLFLDEVGDMGLKMQAKILRALQEGQIQRVGASDTVEVDIRVVAATNKDLRREIREGRFREDLYYRLNVIPVVVPPLRERREDIPALVDFFLRRFSGGRARHVPPATLEMLVAYPWPGNVRELKNWAERACILSPGDAIQTAPPVLEDSSRSERPDVFAFGEQSLRDARHEFEKRFILRVLAENGGNVSKTAQKIGIERSHLHKKLRAYGIDDDASPPPA
jgi:two-component system nitrogen regulation response regulator NtrX